MAIGDEIKERQRLMWSAGDFDQIARTITSVSEHLVERAGVAAGQDVLDVATGTGNTALPAAERGARVTGLDLTPELLDVARDRAAAAGVEVDLIEGDAERLPFEDGSFDRVLTTFGVMFAPDQPQAAAELVRVCRPGGRIGSCAWTPDSLVGHMFALMGSYMPPPPPGFTPPVLWGVEERVRELLEPHGVEISFETRVAHFEADSVEEWVSLYERTLGPVILAKAMLEPDGRWPEARAQLVQLFEEANEERDGSMRAPAEYLVAVADRPG